MKSNSHITNYLDFYCDNTNVLTFAVLLKGRWGCGKSYFIREYIKKERRFLHISLYGLSSLSEVKEKIVTELLPLPELVGRTLNKAKNIPWIKQWIPTDSDDIIIDSFLKTDKGRVIFVFDDLERCSMEISKLLGYINHLVEFQNRKVILIANEESILSEKYQTDYLKVKEKLIGKEFAVNSSAEEAISVFVKNIKNAKLKKSGKLINSLLLKIFYQSKYDNLRLMQQAISSFEYFFKTIEKETEKEPNIFEKLFYEFIVIFIEYKKGEIKSEKFFGEWPQFFKEFSDEKEHFLDKYDNLSHWILYFDVNILGKILQGISLDKTEDELLINKIGSISSLNKESWQNLWNYREVDDKIFFKNLKDVEKKWNKRQYLDFYTILHIIGIFLNFSKIGFIKKNRAAVLKEGKDYISFLIKNNKFPLDLDRQNYISGWRTGVYGLGYHGMDLPEWKDILKFIDGKTKKLRPTFIQLKIKNELMPILRGEREVDNGGLALFVNYNFINSNESFFQYLNVKDVTKIIIERDANFLSIFSSIFEQRYKEIAEQESRIKEEEVFLIALKNNLEIEISKIKKKNNNEITPKSFLVESFIKKSLTPFISKK